MMHQLGNKMQGKITRIISNLYTVEAEGQIYECRARGKFYHDGLTPLVGDLVIIDADNKYILELKPRKNVLLRPTIANIDMAVIITSTKQPNLDLNLLDRLLCIIIHNKIEPIICFTKIDLLSFKDKKIIKNLIKYYRKIGIKCLTNNDIRKLTKMIKDKTVVLTGQTGAGKSTLLNKLDNSLNLATQPISKALGRGKHTTRHVELFKYKTSLIADTPGFSALDLKELTKEDIKNSFLEFNLSCEFKDCMHQEEKNCEVKKLVGAGDILTSRYQNYLKFMEDLNGNKRINY